MTCTRIKDGFICTPNAFVSLAPFGARVWCEMHNHLGPAFYRGENSTDQILAPSKKTWRAFEAWQKSLKENAEKAE